MCFISYFGQQSPLSFVSESPHSRVFIDHKFQVTMHHLLQVYLKRFCTQSVRQLITSNIKIVKVQKYRCMMITVECLKSVHHSLLNLWSQLQEVTRLATLH